MTKEAPGIPLSPTSHPGLNFSHFFAIFRKDWRLALWARRLSFWEILDLTSIDTKPRCRFIIIEFLPFYVFTGDEKLGCQATNPVTTATTLSAGKPLSRSQKVENLQECVDFLEQRGVDTQNVTAQGECWLVTLKVPSFLIIMTSY